MEDQNIKIVYCNGLVRQVSFDEDTVDYFANRWPGFYTGAAGVTSGTLADIVVDFNFTGGVEDIVGVTMANSQQDDPIPNMPPWQFVPAYDETGITALIDDMRDFATQYSTIDDMRVPEWGDHVEFFPAHSYRDWIDRGNKFEGMD